MGSNGFYLDESDIQDKELYLYVTDEEHIDYILGVLTNKDLLRILGRALKLGYRNFVVGIADTDTEVAKMHNGNITVNWDILRKVSKEEWNV